MVGNLIGMSNNNLIILLEIISVVSFTREV